uniref:Uncharacterized protein n=1 Tax=Acrobeloides nanus TaxID=290746 RepID=A0A914D3T0_9BILA
MVTYYEFILEIYVDREVKHHAMLTKWKIESERKQIQVRNKKKSKHILFYYFDYIGYFRNVVNWGQEYLKLKKEKDELQNENKNLSINNALLNKDLELANNKILLLESKLSPCGAIEAYEKQAINLPSVRNDKRSNRWSWIFLNKRSFSQHLDKSTTANDVSILAEEVYNHASSDIHSFDINKGVIVSKRTYSKAHQDFLYAVCKALHCTFTEED